VPELIGLHGRIVATPGDGDALVALLLEAADGLGDMNDCDASLKDERVREVIRRARPLIASMSDSMELVPVGGKGL